MAFTLSGDAATTRTNLGLGDAATKTTGTASGNIPVLDGSGQIASGVLSNAAVADNAITLAKMAHGTDGELITYDATGAPANVAVGTSGQVLTSGGAGVAPTFQAAAGGISQIHQWRFHTGFSAGSGGTITSNWEQVDTDDPSNLGTAMSVNGSGEWTFPSTGHWLITAQILSSGSGDINYVGLQIFTKTGAGWSGASEGYNSTSTTATANISSETSFIFDVTNTSTSLAKFTFNCIPSWITLAGSTNRNYNLFTFTKLADT